MLTRPSLLISDNHINIFIIPHPLQKLRVRTVRRTHVEKLVHALKRDALCLWDKEKSVGC